MQLKITVGTLCVIGMLIGVAILSYTTIQMERGVEFTQTYKMWEPMISALFIGLGGIFYIASIGYKASEKLDREVR